MRALFAILSLVLVASIGRAQEAVEHFGADADLARETLVVHGSTDIEIFRPFLEGFAEASQGLRIRYEQRSTNDIYALAAKACREDVAGADILISSSIDQQIKLVNDGCARPHDSALVDALPEWARWRNEVFGLTSEPAVMVYNRNLVPEAEVPRSRFDLIDLLRPDDNRYRGRITTYDIELAGLGYLFAFADSQQATTFGRLIEAFGRSGAEATCCAAEMIDAVAEGRFLIAYNILGSYALERASRDDRIGVVAPSDYTLLLSRAALIPKSSANPVAAGRMIDFALSAIGKALLAEGFLIVDVAESPGDEGPAIAATTSSLRPITFSPTLLVGLDRHKRRLFIKLWRESFKKAPLPQ